MNYDCAIVGGGPAGLNAALVLGRARRNVAIFDDNRPRNAVTHASHGFITRDGIEPSEFRRIAYEEILSYPSVRHWPTEVTDIRRTDEGFVLRASTGEEVRARKIILSAGLRDVFQEIEGFRDFYGRSLFVCPFCDGWEMRDRPLAIVTRNPAIFHKVKMFFNWSRDLVVCTNGSEVLSAEQQQRLIAEGVRVVVTPIASFSGRDGKLERVNFADGTYVERSGGFVEPVQVPSVKFEAELGYRTSENGGIVTDAMGKTTAAGVFAAGDGAYVMPSQLIYAAAAGSKAGAAVLAELTEEDWTW